MDSIGRVPCYCSKCCGQLVSRRTHFRHKKDLFKDNNTRLVLASDDPFDADVSSPEDDGEMVLGLDDILGLTSTLPSNDQSSEFEAPPLKNARLNVEEVSKHMHKCTMMMHGNKIDSNYYNKLNIMFSMYVLADRALYNGYMFYILYNYNNYIYMCMHVLIIQNGVT